VRILLIHPNYHSGAEIAGNWPPAWATYLAGALKSAGFTDLRFIAAMTNDISDENLRAILAEEKPDIVGCTAITPSIYKAERVLEIVKELHPNAVTVLGGIHATFMYQQVLTEAPLDRRHHPRRGRGNPDQPGPHRRRRQLAGPEAHHQGPGLHRPDSRRHQDRRHCGRAHHQGPRLDRSRLGHPGVGEVHLHPAELPGRHPEHGARLPVHLLVLLAVEVLARLPLP